MYRPCASGTSIASRCAVTTSSMCTKPSRRFGYTSPPRNVPQANPFLAFQYPQIKLRITAIQTSHMCFLQNCCHRWWMLTEWGGTSDLVWSSVSYFHCCWMLKLKNAHDPHNNEDLLKDAKVQQQHDFGLSEIALLCKSNQFAMQELVSVDYQTPLQGYKSKCIPGKWACLHIRVPDSNFWTNWTLLVGTGESEAPMTEEGFTTTRSRPSLAANSVASFSARVLATA